MPCGCGFHDYAGAGWDRPSWQGGPYDVPCLARGGEASSDEEAESGSRGWKTNAAPIHRSFFCHAVKRAQRL